MAKKKNTYVQFSKRMVVFVITAVTVISVMAVLLSYGVEAMTVMQHIVEAYIGFATICFAAYSGNSAVEKWLVRKYAPYRSRDTDDEETDNG